MKEAANKFEAVFKQGLRPIHKRSTSFQLYDLFNFRPTPEGLMPYSPVVIPLADATITTYDLDDEEFPFPQLIVGKKHTFICCSEKIYMVDSDDWDTLTELTTYDADDPTEEKAITAGGVWELADFWDSWFLTNGVCTVFWCGKDWIATHGAQKAYISAVTPIQSMIDYKGRALFGGFDVYNFWSTTADTFLKAWYKKNYDTGFDPYMGSASYIAPVFKNFVWWSSIGGGDVLLFFFPASVLTTGFLTSTFGTDNPFYLEILQRNEQGFAPMPMQGQVLNFRKLGTGLCVFSADGVSYIKSVSSPAPTFDIKTLNEAGGIANRGAVASAEGKGELVYLDNSGTLVKIKASGEVLPLGYKEYLYDMLEEDVVISYSSDPYDGGYFIANKDQTFVLSDKGLFEVGHIVTSVFYKDGATAGLGTALTGTANILGRVGIDANDFGSSGIKTLEWVRVEVDEDSDEDDPIPSLQVSIDYIHTNVGDGTWNSTGYRNVNKEGLVYFPVTGVKFRINIKVSNYANFQIIYAEAGIKQGDKRYTRHFSVGETVN